jgi:ABC-type phosphate/phosphonate transport system substrate-binding protein
MYKILFNILLTTLLTSLLAQAQSDTDLNNPKKLIISLSSFHNAKSEDAQAIAQILANHIRKSRNLNYNFQVETPNTLSEIEKAVGDNFDCAILTTQEYLSLKNKLPLEPFATNVTNGKIGFKYHLIVNKADNITDIKQLKNETLYVLSRDNQNAPFYWIDKLLAEKKLGSYKKFFINTVIDYKASNILLPVFFKKAKACVVTDVALNLMIELNPAIKNKIKILQTSDRFLLGLVALNRKKRNTDLYNLLNEIILSLHENEYGKQLLSLFSADQIAKYKEEYLQNYIKLNK